MLPNSPLLSPRLDPSSSDRRFLLNLKYWMGRLISACAELSVNLCDLICKINGTAQPILDDAAEEVEDPSSKKIISSESSPTPIKLPPSGQKTDVFSDEDDLLTEDDENLEPIMDALFANLGIASTTKEAMASGYIFNLNGVQQEGKNRVHLNGVYQMEWKVPVGEDQAYRTVLYKGNFSKGEFHGTGTLLTQIENEPFYVVLDGSFEKGLFASGLIMMDDCYIEGSFTNGEKTGKGLIHYIVPMEDSKGFSVTDSEGKEVYKEYRGEFYAARPHGKGKMVYVTSDGVKFVSEGEYQSGNLIKGRLQKGSSIFDGTWEEDVFTGTIRNSKKRWRYQGQCVENRFEGKGELVRLQTYKYKEFEQEDEGNNGATQEIPLVTKKGEVKCTYSGEFKDNEIYKGLCEMEWTTAEQNGVAQFDEGSMVNVEVKAKNGMIYRGQFQDFGLTGTGTISTPDGDERYSGEMKYGYPHGAGRLIVGGKIKKGNFEWGNIVED